MASAKSLHPSPHHHQHVTEAVTASWVMIVILLTLIGFALASLWVKVGG